MGHSYRPSAPEAEGKRSQQVLDQPVQLNRIPVSKEERKEGRGGETEREREGEGKGEERKGMGEKGREKRKIGMPEGSM